MEHRILICGDRLWNNLAFVKIVLDKFIGLTDANDTFVVIEGEAKGADTHGRMAAEDRGITVLKFPAQWGIHGKSAGPIRNARMLKEGKPEVVLAFHNDIVNSKGTKSMLKLALKAGIECHLWTEKGEVNVRTK